MKLEKRLENLSESLSLRAYIWVNEDQNEKGKRIIFQAGVAWTFMILCSSNFGFPRIEEIKEKRRKRRVSVKDRDTHRWVLQ